MHCTAIEANEYAIGCTGPGRVPRGTVEANLVFGFVPQFTEHLALDGAIHVSRHGVDAMDCRREKFRRRESKC